MAENGVRSIVTNSNDVECEPSGAILDAYQGYGLEYEVLKESGQSSLIAHVE